MAFVLDASVTINWAFPDEENDAASLIALRRIRVEVARVSAVWWFEVRNVLLIAERRQRISQVDATSFLRFLSELKIEIDRNPDEAAIATLCRRHRLSVYDASYLELALREGIALATLDGKLGTAAEAEGVRPIA